MLVGARTTLIGVMTSARVADLIFALAAAALGPGVSACLMSVKLCLALALAAAALGPGVTFCPKFLAAVVKSSHLLPRCTLSGPGDTADLAASLGADRRPEWAEFKGGNMFELGGHVLDPVVRLLGRPKKVTPYLHTHGKFKDKLADNTAAVLEYDSAMAILHGSNLQPNSGRYRAFEVHGSNGAVIVNPIEPPSVLVDLAKAAGPYKAGRQEVPVGAYKRYVDDFADLAAMIRGEAKPRVSYDDDLLVQEILLRASGM